MTPRLWPEQLEIQLSPHSTLCPLETGSNCRLGPVAEVKTETEGRGSALLLALGIQRMGCTCWLFYYSLFISLIGFCHFLIAFCLERRP